MKVYTDKIYSYAHIVEINKSEIGKIDLAICKQPRETLGNFYKRQTVKPNVLINAGFFSMKNGETIFNVVDEGKEVSDVSGDLCSVLGCALCAFAALSDLWRGRQCPAGGCGKAEGKGRAV